MKLPLRTLQLDLHIASLLFFLSFNVFGRTHNRWVKVITCWPVVVCGSGLESTKFSRLQVRLRLQPKRATRADSTSGFDSDSAALVSCDNVIVLLQFFTCLFIVKCLCFSCITHGCPMICALCVTFHFVVPILRKRRTPLQGSSSITRGRFLLDHFVTLHCRNVYDICFIVRLLSF